MREDICSIPVSEIFEYKAGCPLCRMRTVLEERVVTYITGPAMMEPDVRQETNRKGFCSRHFSQMLSMQKRLSVALTTESLFAELQKRLFKKSGKAETAETCFVCENVEWAMERQIATVCRLYGQEKEFRDLFAQTPVFCLPHYKRLSAAQKQVSKTCLSEFTGELDRITRETLDGLHRDLSHFCSMFDYRNSEADWGTSKDALERAARFLHGE